MNSKRRLATILFVAATALSSCGPTIYKADGLEASKSKMKVLAILPFTISIDSKKLPKGATIETLKESEDKTGYDIQNNIYTWLLHRQKRYTVSFQDVDRTNALLKQAGISYDDIILKDKGDLCELLGVDGIVSGKATMSKPMSEGGAIALALLAGYGGNTNKITATLTIHNAQSALLWKYDYHVSGGLGSSAESISDKLMRKCSRKFPYSRYDSNKDDDSIFAHSNKKTATK